MNIENIEWRGENSDLPAFLRDLSELCRRHGVGITGNPTLFVLERDDYQLEYNVDGEGQLRLR